MIFCESPPAGLWAAVVDRIWVELRRLSPDCLVLPLGLSQGTRGVCQLLIATACEGVYQRQPRIRGLDKSHCESGEVGVGVVLGSAGLFYESESDELVEGVWLTTGTTYGSF